MSCHPLPFVKKYGTHSALNMFDEYSMTDPRQFAEYVGFTEAEVKELCSRYQMDFDEMNFDGLKDAVIQMLADEKYRIDSGFFQNDMTTFRTRDDVLTLLVHLGYLAFDGKSSEVYIPNMEIREFPSGPGFADIVYIPKKNIDKPAMIMELKYDKFHPLYA